jgi:hypothetical protein
VVDKRKDRVAEPKWLRLSVPAGEEDALWSRVLESVRDVDAPKLAEFVVDKVLEARSAPDVDIDGEPVSRNVRVGVTVGESSRRVELRASEAENVAERVVCRLSVEVSGTRADNVTVHGRLNVSMRRADDVAV